MIIMGYPGIGKTTLAKGDYRFIDLDSTSTLLTGMFRKKGWEKQYVSTALYLSKKGYHVFVSTHPEVIKKVIAMDGNDAILVYPSRDIKSYWLQKLRDRYEQMRNRSTHNAWRRAWDHFDEDIEELGKVKCHQIVLETEKYDLKKDLVHVITGLNGGGF